MSVFLSKVFDVVWPTIRRTIAILPKRLNLHLLDAVVRALGITGIGYTGGNGEFFGEADDRVMMGAYLRKGAIFVNTIAFITEHAKGGTYIDVGTNIGFLAVPIATQGIRCICFEPDPRNFRLLRQNAIDVKIEAHNIALYDRKSTLDFERSPVNSSDHRVRVANPGSELRDESTWEVIRVPAERMDDILDAESLARPIIVKIDAQGSEVAIFKGGKTFLSKADILIFEYEPYVSRRQNYDERDLIHYVQDHFSEACMIEGGSDDPIVFGPVADTVAKMREMSETYPHFRYADVFARK